MLNLYMSHQVDIPELSKWFDEPMRYGNMDENNTFRNTEFFWGNGVPGQIFPIQSFYDKNQIDKVIVDNLTIDKYHYEIENGFLKFDQTIVAKDIEKIKENQPNIIVIGNSKNSLFQNLKFLRNGTIEERTKFEKVWLKNDTPKNTIHEDINISVIDALTMDIKNSSILIDPRYPLNHPINKKKIFKVEFMNATEDIYPPDIDDNNWDNKIKFNELKPGEKVCFWVKGYVKYLQINKKISNIVFTTLSNYIEQIEKSE
jgi:hypothetical protein